MAFPNNPPNCGSEMPKSCHGRKPVQKPCNRAISSKSKKPPFVEHHKPRRWASVRVMVVHLSTIRLHLLALQPLVMITDPSNGFTPSSTQACKCRLTLSSRVLPPRGPFSGRTLNSEAGNTSTKLSRGGHGIGGGKRNSTTGL